MESVIPETKKQAHKIERVILDSISIAAIQSLQHQVNDQLGDLVQISQKDIVNFILQERAFTLTEDELSKLKSRHFDLVKALKKATSEVIKAKQNGSEIQLDEVLKIIQTQSVTEFLPPKKLRGRRKKALVGADTTNQDSINNDSTEVNKNEQKHLPKNQNSDSKSQNSQISKSSNSP